MCTHAFLLVRVCPNTPIIFSKLAAHPLDAFFNVRFCIVHIKQIFIFSTVGVLPAATKKTIGVFFIFISSWSFAFYYFFRFSSRRRCSKFLILIAGS